MFHEFVSWTDGGGAFQTLPSFYMHIYICSFVPLSVHSQCGAAQQQPWVWINESILTRQYRLMLDSAVFFSSNVYYWILMFRNCQVMQKLWLVPPRRRRRACIAERNRKAEKEKKEEENVLIAATHILQEDRSRRWSWLCPSRSRLATGTRHTGRSRPLCECSHPLEHRQTQRQRRWSLLEGVEKIHRTRLKPAGLISVGVFNNVENKHVFTGTWCL